MLHYASYEKKRCKVCSYSLQKWGKNKCGSQRYKCPHCDKSNTRKRPELSSSNRRKLFSSWLLGKQSLTQIALIYGITRQTLHKWFIPFWLDEPIPKRTSATNIVLIIDGKSVERNACVLIACIFGRVVSWQFTQRETAESWYHFLSVIRLFPFAIVSDGQRGMLKAIKQRFPGVVIQRCQFHVIQYCLTKLTKKPETRAAQELRLIVLQIARVKTKDHFGLWLTNYIYWRKTYDSFLKERTHQEQNLTPTGKNKWHYTHGKLHAAHSHLKNALPNLFQYLRYPQIPNTTNYVEGAINSPMREKLRFHRGLNLNRRRILIAYFLRSKQL